MACTAGCSRDWRTPRSLSPNHLVAVSVVSDEEEQEKLEQLWQEYGLEVPLEIVYSPYRELTRPILRYVDELDARWENDVITVLLPEFVVRHWWGNILHNQTALLLKGTTAVPQGHGRHLAPVSPGVTTDPQPKPCRKIGLDRVQPPTFP